VNKKIKSVYGGEIAIFSKFSKNLISLLQILKFKSCIVDVSVVVATASLIPYLIDSRIILALVCAILIHLACDIYNDIQDLEIDKICKPTSPLVTGELSVEFSYFSSAILLGIALLSSYVLSSFFFIMSLFGFLLGGIMYSHPLFRLKDKPGLSMLFCLGYGIEVVGVWSIFGPLDEKALTLAIHVFILSFSLAFLKDYKDIQGDKNSLILKMGIEKSNKVCMSLIFVPFVSFAGIVTMFGLRWFPLIVYIFSAYFCIKILKNHPEKKGHMLRNWMFIAIVSPNFGFVVPY
jgi:4-hydroxybenzoate polyprenyltransferase